jgi:hypothetical protein
LLPLSFIVAAHLVYQSTLGCILLDLGLFIVAKALVVIVRGRVRACGNGRKELVAQRGS